MHKTTVASKRGYHPFNFIRSRLDLIWVIACAAWMAGSAGPLGLARAGLFPNSAVDGQTFSIGVCQFVVDPSFNFLFAPVGLNSLYYPGYAGPGSGILTSPVMFDGNTMIGESASQTVGSESFPAQAGTAALYPVSPNYRAIQGYGDYPFIPSGFTPLTVVPAGVHEIFTQIEEMHLVGYVAPSNAVPCNDPRVPNQNSGGSTGQGGGTPITVKAGPGPLGIGSSLPLNRRSIGIVQQLNNGSPDDFPAQSFFDIFVEIDLPGVAGTASFTDFPVVGGTPTAILYNDVNNPLFIENLALTNLPPEATYVHGQTTAVPVRFRDNNPPYWSANDVLGYLTLAGHGVFTNIVTAQAPCAAATATGGLLDRTLGPVGSPIPPPSIPWLTGGTARFPSTNSTFNSVANTFVDPVSGATNVMDQVVVFPVGPTNYYLRDLVITNMGSTPIFPPALNVSETFNLGQKLFFQISLDGVSFVPQLPGSGMGGTGQLSITNAGTSGPVTNFNTEWLSGIFSGANPFGGPAIRLRESPTLQSLGRATVQGDPRGYRIGSFFDIFLELSVDNGVTWNPATNSVRLLVGIPAPVPNNLFAQVNQTKTKLFLQWQNSFTLQSASSVLGPWSDVAGPVHVGPYTNSIGPGAQFFRLRQ